MTEPDEAGFQVESVWKEQLVYWEGSRGFVFDAAWGVTPFVVYVPSEADWDSCVPEWMAGRHDEIVARIATHSNHTIRVGPYPAGEGRTITR